MNGTKIIEMTVAESDIRFIDSLNFLLMPLSKVPKTLGLTELAKGYFPHFFNTEGNQHIGPLPDAKYYDTEGMKPEGREAFYKWYNTQCEKHERRITQILSIGRGHLKTLLSEFRQDREGFVQDRPF